MERWLSGRKRLIANPLYDIPSYRGFESLSLRKFFTYSFSSHILSEVQATCQDIRMIENGHMVFSDTLDAFNNYIEADKLTASFENPPVISALTDIPEVTNAVFLSPKKVQITFTGTQEIAEKIIANIRALALPHAATDNGIVTLSIGIASFCSSSRCWDNAGKEDRNHTTNPHHHTTTDPHRERGIHEQFRFPRRPAHAHPHSQVA